MKSFHVCATIVGLGLCCLAVGARAQKAFDGSPSLLPLPQADYRYPLPSSAAYRWQPDVLQVQRAQEQPEEAPSAVPAPEEPTGPAVQSPQPGQGQAAAPPDYEMYETPAACPSCGGFHAPGACGLGLGDLHGGHFGERLSLGSVFGRGGRLHSLFAGRCSGGPCAEGGDPGALASRCGWFAGAAGLIMTRDNGNHYFFSVENSATTEHIQLLDVRDAEMEWSGGFEARFGHFFHCGQDAWEVVYWGLFPSRQQFTLFGADFANPLDGILDWSQISIFDPTANGGAGGDVPANSWVDNADAHRIQRDFEFHNVELNLLNYAGCATLGACGQPRLHYRWGFGVRYFRFTEELLFSAKEAGSGTVFDGGVDQANYFIDVENNLTGAQITGDGQYYLGRRWSLTFGTKLGIYGNHISQRSVISSAGNVAFVNNGPLNGSLWNIGTSKDDLALLGELNVGLDWQINHFWSATLGYRAVAVTGVALPSNQIPGDLRGVNDAAIVQSNGSLILHGGYAGIALNY